MLEADVTMRGFHKRKYGVADCCLQVVVEVALTHSTHRRSVPMQWEEMRKPNPDCITVKSKVMASAVVLTQWVLAVVLLKFTAALCQEGCGKGSGIIFTSKYGRCGLYAPQRRCENSQLTYILHLLEGKWPSGPGSM